MRFSRAMAGGLAVVPLLVGGGLVAGCGGKRGGGFAPAPATSSDPAGEDLGGDEGSDGDALTSDDGGSGGDVGSVITDPGDEGPVEGSGDGDGDGAGTGDGDGDGAGLDPLSEAPAGPTRLTLGEPVDAAISTAGEEDWYVAALVAGETYRVWTSNLDDGMDSAVAAWAPDLSPIGANDDAEGLGLASSLTFTASADGDHYLKVWHDAGATGTYTVTIEPADEGSTGGGDVAPVTTLGIVYQSFTERVISVDEPLTLAASVVAADADEVTFRWRQGVAPLATGTIATPGSAAVAVPPYTVEAGELAVGTWDLVLEVEDEVGAVTATFRITVSDQAITLTSLGIKPEADAVAPLVRIIAPRTGETTGRSLVADVAAAAYKADDTATFEFLGEEVLGLNDGNSNAIEVYLDTTRIWQGTLPEDLKIGQVQAGPLDLTGFAAGPHVLTVVAYQGTAGSGLGRLARVAIAIEDAAE